MQRHNIKFKDYEKGEGSKDERYPLFCLDFYYLRKAKKGLELVKIKQIFFYRKFDFKII